MLRATWIVLVALALGGAAGAAENGLALHRAHGDIALTALRADTNRSFDTSSLAAEPGLRKLAAAFDLLVERSPMSRRAIAALQENGRVELVYLPGERKTETGHESAASFFPDFRSGRQPAYVVVVWRHAIKWPVAELAAALAHELVGHGMQFRRNRLTNIRVLDSECEARLYQEWAIQDLGLDKFDPEMIRFRQALERRFCADFKSYMRSRVPERLPMWDDLNPDIPGLLRIFDVYLERLARDGVTGRSVALAEQQRKRDREQRLKHESPARIFRFAMNLRYGGIGVQQDIGEALRYFKIAGDRGHADAQRIAGRMRARAIMAP